MTFRTQRLANKFPKWSKLRRDPSSMGQRFLSVFADYFDFLDTELVKVQDELHLLKFALGKPYVWAIDLQGDDLLPETLSVGGNTIWTYPTTVTGTHAVLGDLTVTRVESLEELFWSAPSRIESVETITVSDYEIYNSSTGTINDIAYPERLQVVVSGSTEYFKRRTLRNPKASNQYYLIVEGLDANHNTITEYMFIRDDGVYFTRNIFKEVTSVIQEGFDGDVSIYLTAPYIQLKDKYHIASSEDDEGLALLGLNLATGELTYSIQRFKSGATYRQGEALTIDNEVEVWSQLLRDSSSVVYTPVAFALNWDTARLYVLDDTGYVHVYEHGITPFSPPSDAASITTATYIDIQPLKSYASLNEVMTIFTRHEQIRHPIVGVTIKRINPSGTVEYLQANETWAVTAHEFVPTVTAQLLPEESWQDLTFTSTFNTVGIWEFYCTTRVLDGSTSVSYTGVMVDTLDALASLDTGVSSPTSLYFGENGDLYVSDASEVHRFSEHADLYIVDEPSQQMFFRENYTAVEVIP